MRLPAGGLPSFLSRLRLRLTQPHRWRWLLRRLRGRWSWGVLLELQQIQKVDCLIRGRLPLVAPGSWHIGAQNVRAVVRRGIGRTRAEDGRRDRGMVVTMLLKRLLRLRAVLSLIGHGRAQALGELGRLCILGRRGTRLDAREQSLEIVWGGHFCRSPRLGRPARYPSFRTNPHKSSLSRASFRKKLSAEETEGLQSNKKERLERVMDKGVSLCTQCAKRRERARCGYEKEKEREIEAREASVEACSAGDGRVWLVRWLWLVRQRHDMSVRADIRIDSFIIESWTRHCRARGRLAR